jgi:hypothetical protein
MTGTGSPGGTEQLAGALGDLLFADVVAMEAHYRPDDGKVSPDTRMRRGFPSPLVGEG